METDNRPDPKPRKHPQLWQSYLFWEEWIEYRKRHTLRLRDIEKGKSNLSADIERDILAGDLVRTKAGQPLPVDEIIKSAEKMMAVWGEQVGPVWDWVNSIRGIGPNLAAKTLALIDDIALFDTISKLWRYAGHGMYEYWVDEKGGVIAPREGWKDRPAKKGEWVLYGKLVPPNTPGARLANAPGERMRVHVIAEPKDGWELVRLSDRDVGGWCSSQNKALKSVLWQCGDSFVKQRAAPYRGIYDLEKIRLRDRNPEKVKVNGKWMWNDGHLHNMAMRKIRKVFLSHIWLVWRESEGLPVSEPWVIEHGGHKDYVPPPNWPMEPSTV